MDYTEGAGKTLTLRSLMEEYIACAENMDAESSRKKYLMSVRALERALGRAPTVTDLTKDSLVRALKQLAIQPSTRNGYLRCIKAMWGWAQNRTIAGTAIPALPKFKKFKVPRKNPVSLRKYQMRNVLSAIQEYNKILPSGVPGSIFFEALFRLCALNGGERIGAVTSIRRDWWDGGRIINVPGHVRKNGKPKVYSLRDDVFPAIKALADSSESELLFDSGLTYDGLRGRWRTIMKRAGLEGRDFMFHGLRRTFYTQFKAAGGNPGAVMGHESDLSRHYEDRTITGTNDCSIIQF